MFDNLTGRLSEAARSLTGKGRLTEANIKDTLRQVRLALLGEWTARCSGERRVRTWLK